MNKTVILKPNQAKPVLRRHPWIFSGSIARVEGDPADADIVDVRDSGGSWLAREALRDDPGTTAYRLVHAESDYLPGLIVDRYGNWLVTQFLTLGMDRRRGEIADALASLLSPRGIRGIYERSDVDVREKEGLAQRAGPLQGEEPPELVEIQENGHRFLVDVREGHKTGFYLDQRENRARLSAFCENAEVLDAFSYTGACAVYAAAGGAKKVTLVDSSAPSLELARRNLAPNSSGPAGRVRDPAILGRERRFEYVEGDVFSVLCSYRAEERRFDVIVLDPPKFARSKHDVQRASPTTRHQPAGLPTATTRRRALHLLLLQRGRCGSVPKDRLRRRGGHGPQGSDHRAPSPGRRSPGGADFPRGRIPEGPDRRVW